MSDGAWTPERIKQEYKKRGYSVVAITDHERLVTHHDLTDDKILFLTAYEAFVRPVPFDKRTGVQSHMNFYSKTPENALVYYTPELTTYIPKEELETLKYHKFVEHRHYEEGFIQEFVSYAKECGYLVCHNHPTWSFEDESCIDMYKDCFAMEIYNNGCFVIGHNEFNEHIYNRQIRKGRKMALIASDDNHDAYDANHPRCDSFGGITYILADSLDYDSIITALENKDFYASQGPQIFMLGVENNVLKVETSSATSIFFITNLRCRRSSIGENLTELELELNDDIEWVYVVVTDKNGKSAYSRAYFKEEFQ